MNNLIEKAQELDESHDEDQETGEVNDKAQELSSWISERWLTRTKSCEIEYFQYKIYIIKPGAEFLLLQKPALPPISIDWMISLKPSNKP